MKCGDCGHDVSSPKYEDHPSDAHQYLIIGCLDPDCDWEFRETVVKTKFVNNS